MKYTNEVIQKHTKHILAIFRNRCVICRKQPVVVHEIVPKSINFDWLVDDNRVTLCYKCHEEVHQNGAMNYVETLQAYRNRRLVEYGNI